MQKAKWAGESSRRTTVQTPDLLKSFQWTHRDAGQVVPGEDMDAIQFRSQTWPYTPLPSGYLTVSLIIAFYNKQVKISGIVLLVLWVTLVNELSPGFCFVLFCLILFWESSICSLLFRSTVDPLGLWLSFFFQVESVRTD